MPHDDVSVTVFQTRRMTADRAMEYLSGTVLPEIERRKSDFLVMPEKWVTDQFSTDSGTLDDILSFFMDISESAGTTSVPGSFSVRRGDKLYNSAPVISEGRIMGWQDKISLFRQEKSSYTAGSSTGVFSVNGMKVSVSVCYDSDFPYYARMAALNGSEIMFNPALIHGDFHDMWKIYIEARALENRIPFVSVNSLSEPFRGNSIISLPERYMFGAKLNTRVLGKDPAISVTLSLDGLAELRRDRLNEDPGEYRLNGNK